MGQETEKLAKQNGKMRSWIERQLGKAVFILIPGVFTVFAGWIYTIGNDITDIKASLKQNDEKWENLQNKQKADKENQAQWNALLGMQEKSKNLEIEVELYKRMFYLMVDKDVDPTMFHLERAFGNPGHEPGHEERNPDDEPEDPRRKINVRKPFRIVVPRGERIKEFKREQIEQVQRQRAPGALTRE